MILKVQAILVGAILCGSVAWSQTPARHDTLPRTGCSSDSKSCSEVWIGTRSSEGQSESLILHVTFSNGTGKGTVDLPDFGAVDIPASKFAMDGSKIHFELVGDFSTTFFDGSTGGDVLRGSWKEGARVGDFEL